MPSFGPAWNSLDQNKACLLLLEFFGKKGENKSTEAKSMSDNGFWMEECMFFSDFLVGVVALLGLYSLVRLLFQKDRSSRYRFY
ncbi:MAG TPA: hypothetical protein VLM37_11250 [Fibrobacteraceae bacterium]|nr:hypothetical protein [Fibrobacteraceae bacterium]